MRSKKRIVLFFSYSSADRRVVAAAARLLGRLGYRVWMDVTCLAPGMPFPVEIADVIVNQADFFVAFLPVDGRLSGWLKHEYRLAQDRANASDNSTFIIPVLLGKKARSVPAMFRGLNLIQLPGTSSDHLHAFGKAMRIAVAGKAERRASVLHKRKTGKPRHPSGLMKPAEKPAPVDEVLASITSGSSSLSVWAHRLSGFLKAWSVLLVRRQRRAGWVCVASTGIDKRLLKDISRLPRQYQPPSRILPDGIIHERKEAVVPQGRNLVVNFDSRLWAPVCLQANSARARVVGAIGAFSSSLRSKGEFLTIHRDVLRAMAVKLADRTEFNC